jgi:hypothetical protein
VDRDCSDRQAPDPRATSGSGAPPFGQEFVAEVPLIESVPGALDASAKEINVTVGAASKQGKMTSYYLVVPKKCPPGGFPLKAVMSFLGGATASLVSGG